MTAFTTQAKPVVDSPALGFVAVLSTGQRDRAEEALRRILTDLDDGAYAWHAQDGLARAVRTDNPSINLSAGDDRDVVVLGNLVSQCVGPDKATAWAARAMDDGRHEQLKACQGVFALVTIDWTRGTVRVGSDLLGIRPFYLASVDGLTILSDRAEAAIRLGGGQLDPLGVAGWLYFNTPLVNRTMFRSVERLAPASVITLDGATRRDACYWRPPVDEKPIDAEELMDRFMVAFNASTSRLLAPHDKATSFLSGGFDSRLCLLSALAEGRVALDAITTPYTQAEADVVRQLSEATGVPCKHVPIAGAYWDQFDAMWLGHPDGYPVTKSMSSLCMIESGGGRAFLDGSISAVAIRCISGNPASGPPADEAEGRAFVWKAHVHDHPALCFREAACERFEQLARQIADEQSDAIGWNSKFALQWDMYTDERRFSSINFLQHAHRAEVVVPFYDRALMELHLGHPQAMFTPEFYRALLKRAFPGPGGLPHASDLAKGRDTVYLFSRALWRLVPSLLAFARRHRDVLKSGWLLTRVGSYGLGLRRYMYAVMALTRLLCLENECRRLGLELDLASILSRGGA